MPRKLSNHLDQMDRLISDQGAEYIDNESADAVETLARSCRKLAGKSELSEIL